MGFRFRKSFQIVPGLRVNLSKSGVSASIGGPGLTTNVSGKGVRSTLSIPGTGISYVSQRSSSPQQRTAPPAEPMSYKTESLAEDAVRALRRIAVRRGRALGDADTASVRVAVPPPNSFWARMNIVNVDGRPEHVAPPVARALQDVAESRFPDRGGGQAVEIHMFLPPLPAPPPPAESAETEPAPSVGTELAPSPEPIFLRFCCNAVMVGALLLLGLFVWSRV